MIESGIGAGIENRVGVNEGVREMSMGGVKGK